MWLFNKMGKFFLNPHRDAVRKSVQFGVGGGVAGPAPRPPPATLHTLGAPAAR
jgi:hypothetical protein